MSMYWLAFILFVIPTSPCLAFNYYSAKDTIVTVYCEKTKSFGGGVIVSRNNIVSMKHVASECALVIVGFSDGTYSAGTVTAVDAANDLVTIRPEKMPELVHVAQLETGTPKMGNTLHLIGHPDGLTWLYAPAQLAYPNEREVYISGRKINVLIAVAESSGGTSGGGLFDESGHVVGFAEGDLENTSFTFFVPSGAVCKRLMNCKVS